MHSLALAQSLTDGNWVTLLPNLGVSGFIIWWLTQQVVPRLDAIRDALDRSSKVLLMQLLTHPNLPDAAKPAAEELLAKIQVNDK